KNELDRLAGLRVCRYTNARDGRSRVGEHHLAAVSVDLLPLPPLHRCTVPVGIRYDAFESNGLARAGGDAGIAPDAYLGLVVDIGVHRRYRPSKASGELVLRGRSEIRNGRGRPTGATARTSGILRDCGCGRLPCAPSARA